MKPSEKLSGFATFFKEDKDNGKYFFQFVNEEGHPIFYSHGYQSERSRDNGIQVAIRNAGEDERYERQQTKKQQYYFLLKSGNNQEVGRSITFESKAEMEEKIKSMKDITEDTPVFDAADLISKEKKEATQTVEELSEKPSAKELLIENMPRYKFSIIYYPDSDVWTIKHDQSGNARQFKTYDGKMIEEFLTGHLPIDPARAISHKTIAQPKTPVLEGVPRKKDKVFEEEIEMKIQSLQGERAKDYAKASNLGHLEILLKQGTSISSGAFEAKVTAKSLESNEMVVIAEVKDQNPAHGRFLIPIYEANKLKPGMYRFSVSIHQGKAGEEEHDYSGSSLVMLN